MKEKRVERMMVTENERKKVCSERIGEKKNGMSGRERERERERERKSKKEKDGVKAVTKGAFMVLSSLFRLIEYCTIVKNKWGTKTEMEDVEEEKKEEVRKKKIIAI